MHRSSYLRMEYLVHYYDSMIITSETKVNVLDIGSYDVNGSYRSIFDSDVYHYSGLDMSEGPNVDIVPKDVYHWNEIKDQTFDLVISGQALEHIEYPWLTMKEVARVLKPSGICIIIVPSSTEEHRYPIDCYRYYPDGMAALAKQAELNVIHLSTGGIPEIDAADDWTGADNDTVIVAQKRPVTNKPEDPFRYEKRMGIDGEVIQKYRTWQMAVEEACKEFDREKQIILFGANEIGSQILNIVGEGKVYCFVDDQMSRTDGQFCDKKVLSFAEYCNIEEKYNCLIAADQRTSFKMKKQLEIHGKQSAILYIEPRQNQWDKMECYYHILNIWLEMKQKGKSLASFFETKKIKRIAIYGMKELGKRFYDEVTDIGIQVVCVIDKNPDSVSGEFAVISPEQEIPDADSVVVTAEYYYQEIRRQLGGKVNCPVYSLLEVLKSGFELDL